MLFAVSIQSGESSLQLASDTVEIVQFLILVCTTDVRVSIVSVDIVQFLSISQKNTRGVKTCPPCMFEELQDRKSHENHVVDLGKIAL